MKKRRKQTAYVNGQKVFVDVPFDKALYAADNRAEYQRRRSKKKHCSFDDTVCANVFPDVAEILEEKMLHECLHQALQTLTPKEQQVVKCLFFENLSEQKTAERLLITKQAVNKQKRRIIAKLKNILKDWH